MVNNLNLFQSNTTQTKISRFSISPTLNSLPAATIDALPPKPLHIIVSDENQRLPTIKENADMSLQVQRIDAEAAVSTSPADSIDSGVASPGISPISGGSATSADDEAFSKLKMRDRSVSDGSVLVSGRF